MTSAAPWCSTTATSTGCSGAGVPVEYRDARGHRKSARVRVIDFDNAPGSNRFLAVRELKLTGIRTPNYNRRADLVCFVNGLPLVIHRAEGGLPEHPRGVRQQPLRLPGRERHRPCLPSQRLPDRVERRPRPLRLDHQRVGALRRVEAARRGGQGQPGRRGDTERHAGARSAARHRRELHPVRREQAGRHAEGHCAKPPGTRRQPGGGVGRATGGAEAQIPAGRVA